MNFKSRPLSYVLVPLCVLAIAASFYRFIVAGDFIVEYEGACDPATESCFFACETEECADVYYFSWVRKHNADVRAQCGTDITDCEAANVCLPTDRACSIAYCDPGTGECVGPGVVTGSGEEADPEASDEEPEEPAVLMDDPSIQAI